MPGKHSENTTLIGTFVKKELAELLKEQADAKGVSSSQMLREALVEYLARRGVFIPRGLGDAPSRKGKGGPKKKISSSGKRDAAAVVYGAELDADSAALVVLNESADAPAPAPKQPLPPHTSQGTTSQSDRKR